MNLKDAADSYAKATAEFLKVAQELSEAELDSSSSRGWTARQVMRTQEFTLNLVSTQSRIGLKLIHDIPQNMRLKSDPAYRATLL